MMVPKREAVQQKRKTQYTCNATPLDAISCSKKLVFCDKGSVNRTIPLGKLSATLTGNGNLYPLSSIFSRNVACTARDKLRATVERSLLLDSHTVAHRCEGREHIVKAHHLIKEDTLRHLLDYLRQADKKC